MDWDELLHHKHDPVAAAELGARYYQWIVDLSSKPLFDMDSFAQVPDEEDVTVDFELEMAA